jgi:hypothetical protein
VSESQEHWCSSEHEGPAGEHFPAETGSKAMELLSLKQSTRPEATPWPVTTRIEKLTINPIKMVKKIFIYSPWVKNSLKSNLFPSMGQEFCSLREQCEVFVKLKTIVKLKIPARFVNGKRGPFLFS